jgi:tRNA modification GTPase
MPVNLIDTAGLRPTLDAVEAEGVRRATAEIIRADHVLYLIDAAAPAEPLESVSAQLPPGIPVTLVFNKIDLTGQQPHRDESSQPPRLYLSAEGGQGLELLREHLKTAAGFQSVDAGAFAARRRHLDALARARAAVQTAAEVLQSSRAFELFAEDLRMAQRALGEITGEFTSDDLLGEIFSSFCIGK